MALGASARSIRLRVLRQSGLVVFVGLAAGLPFAVLAARAADSLLWDVTSSDPATYGVAAAILCLVGLASAYIPAHTASRVEPSEALRHG
jgi:ABC-type antimicrobial peptide transport system permease subunit